MDCPNCKGGALAIIRALERLPRDLFVYVFTFLDVYAWVRSQVYLSGPVYEAFACFTTDCVFQAENNLRGYVRKLSELTHLGRHSWGCGDRVYDDDQRRPDPPYHETAYQRQSVVYSNRRKTKDSFGFPFDYCDATAAHEANTTYLSNHYLKCRLPKSKRKALLFGDILLVEPNKKRCLKRE